MASTSISSTSESTRAFMQQHKTSIEEAMSAAVNAAVALKEPPADPIKFIAEHLRSQADAAASPRSPVPAVAVASAEVVQLRAQLNEANSRIARLLAAQGSSSAERPSGASDATSPLATPLPHRWSRSDGQSRAVELSTSGVVIIMGSVNMDMTATASGSWPRLGGEGGESATTVGAFRQVRS